MLISSTLTAFLLPLVNAFLEPESQVVREIESRPLEFHLRHIHELSTTNGRVRLQDVPKSFVHDQHRVDSQAVFTHRPLHKRGSLLAEWEQGQVIGPDVERRETLLQLAKMANNAYASREDTDWYDLGPQWPKNASHDFGWEPAADGFRGHVFATEDNSTVVVSIKGTSAGLLGGGGPTVAKDKLNDNLLFSCCCARVDWTWTTVCGCYRGGWQCNQDCVEEALAEDSLFYSVGINLYNNLTYAYPDSNIWVIGHSLGGALASLIGVTFGVPVVAFEAPGEKMAAGRLHLPSPPSTQHITHVYHTADPIAMGTCNGILSSCAITGYAMESRCHLGKSITYDTVSNLSWSVDIRTHSIVNVIDKVLAVPWLPAVDEGREVPEPKEEEDCVECFSWDYGNY